MERNYLNEWKQFLTEQSKEEILQVQQALNRVWTNVKIKADGIMGPATTKYIKLFQDQNGLTVNGIIDDALKGKLLPLLQGAPDSQGDAKAELISVITNHLNSMKNDKTTASDVAQIIYNDAAHWMNKTDIFKDRPGEPMSVKAPFAPRQ